MSETTSASRHRSFGCACQLVESFAEPRLNQVEHIEQVTVAITRVCSGGQLDATWLTNEIERGKLVAKGLNDQLNGYHRNE